MSCLLLSGVLSAFFERPFSLAVVQPLCLLCGVLCRSSLSPASSFLATLSLSAHACLAHQVPSTFRMANQCSFKFKMNPSSRLGSARTARTSGLEVDRHWTCCLRRHSMRTETLKKPSWATFPDSSSKNSLYAAGSMPSAINWRSLRSKS
uniref:Uncharacterized protein n=1 Tax=Toxoplasma gondii COUG TaxID=1074873 RepID=A0A2G8Y822_TOXGO|nr:hypothetical protein TGCOUG_363470 [Toxoplasma gondii COUG]